MKILVISNNYPSKYSPHKGTFVYELVQKFVQGGNEVTVISPTKFEFARRVEKDYGNEVANVFWPKFLSFSNRSFFNFNTFRIGRFFQTRAIKRTVRKFNPSFEVVYAHFVANGLMAVDALKNLDTPIFVAVGEYRGLDLVRGYYNRSFYNSLINKVAGFIAVSPQVKAKLIDFGIQSNKIIIEPNAVDRSVFKPLDKSECRKRLHLPQDKKIVLFVGHFLQDKGPLRVLEALNRFPDDVVGVFIGKGPQVIKGDKVAFCGPLLHHEIPVIMGAADVFVLPTLHEGSSNVIVEAMSCGLPIVSSDIPEIKVQCDPSFSILIDPFNVNAIEISIKKILSDDASLSQYAKSARFHSEKFDLERRSQRILDFMEKSLSS